MITRVCWFVRSFPAFVVIRVKVQLQARFSCNLAQMFICQMPLLTFERSRSKYKVKTAVMKVVKLQ